MAKNKNPLDDIVNEMVVFRHEDGEYVSNSPFWQDSRIRARWIQVHGEAAPGELDTTDDEDELPAYVDLTNEELRIELLGRKLSVGGTKAEMVARLEKDDAESTGE